MSRGWLASRKINTGEFIREYLAEHNEAYPYEIWKALKEEKKALGLAYGSYVSFISNYILPLKKAGFIEAVRVEDKPIKRDGTDYIPNSKEKIIYRLNKNKITALEWYDVQSLKRKFK